MNLHKLSTRFATCFKILFIYKNWVCVNLTKQELDKIAESTDPSAEIIIHGLKLKNLNKINVALAILNQIKVKYSFKTIEKK